MADVTPRGYIVGIVLFTLVIASGVAMIAEFTESDPSYGNPDDLQQFNSTFNVINDITDEVGTLESNIENADTDFGTFGVLNSLINSGWQTIKLLVGGLGFMNTALYGLSTFFGIPAFIIGLVTLLVSIVIVFALYSAIFQTKI